MKNSTLESLKELGRTLLLAVVSYLLVNQTLIERYISFNFNGKLGPDGSILFIGVVFALLNALDKFIHQYGKETDNKLLITGLTRF